MVCAIFLQRDPDAFQEKLVTAEKEIRTVRSEAVNLPGGSLGWRAREPSRSSSGGSPVSVITSSPPVVPLFIKSEPLSSEWIGQSKRWIILAQDVLIIIAHQCSFRAGPRLPECHVEGARGPKWKRRRAMFCTYYVKMRCFCIFNLYCQLVDCLEMLTADGDTRTYDEWRCDAVPNFFWLK